MKRSSLIRSGVIALAILMVVSLGFYLLPGGDEQPGASRLGDERDIDFGLVNGDNEPLPSDAKSIAEGLEALRKVVGVGRVIDAIERRDVEALLALFESKPNSCSQLAHGQAGPECPVMNGEVDGSFQAIGIEDGGSHWMLAEVRARPLLTAVLAAEPVEIVLATRESNTPEGLGGLYYLAFSTQEFDASDEAFNYASDTVGKGSGLKVVARQDQPIVEFSLLSPNWQPLQWLGVDGYSAPYDVDYVLLFPRELEGFFHRHPSK
jgi:hypothetical protein